MKNALKQWYYKKQHSLLLCCQIFHHNGRSLPMVLSLLRLHAVRNNAYVAFDLHYGLDYLNYLRHLYRVWRVNVVVHWSCNKLNVACINMCSQNFSTPWRTAFTGHIQHAIQEGSAGMLELAAGVLDLTNELLLATPHMPHVRIHFIVLSLQVSPSTSTLQPTLPLNWTPPVAHKCVWKTSILTMSHKLVDQSAGSF